MCSVSKMGRLAAWASHRSLHIAGRLLLSLSLVQPSETQKVITRELLVISRLLESSDYTTFLLTLAIEKFGSPGTQEVSVSLVLPSLQQKYVIFPSAVHGQLFDLTLSPFRN